MQDMSAPLIKLQNLSHLPDAEKDLTEYEGVRPFEDKENSNDKSDNLSEIDMNIPSDSNNKHICNRYFSNMGPGSLRGSIFNLSIVSIGVGALTLPVVFRDLGIVFATFLIILFGFTTYWTLTMLIFAGRKSGLSIYGEVCKHYLGVKASKFYDIVNLFFSFGVIVVYYIICK